MDTKNTTISIMVQALIITIERKGRLGKQGTITKAMVGSMVTDNLEGLRSMPSGKVIDIRRRSPSITIRGRQQHMTSMLSLRKSLPW